MKMYAFGDHFQMLKLLKNVKFIKFENDKHIIEKKLDILYEYGGIILEKNILCYKNIQNYGKDLIFFRDEWIRV